MDKGRILIVEDEALVAVDIQDSLVHLGYQVIDSVASGEDAIKSTEENHPDLVLMDIALSGGMDGTEAAAEIRRRFNTPVVYLSAYSDDAVLNRAKKTEPNGYLLKPFREVELKSAVEMAIYKHSMEVEREKHVRELQDALAKVKQLSGMLPICASCKKIRDDKGYWEEVASYITSHSEVIFSHGYCPECADKAQQELKEFLRDDQKTPPPE
jgi:two-component system, response regulator PdtaR